MPLTVTTEHAQIRALLEDVIAADPVRGTVLGTIATSLEDGAWCGSAPGRLAVRSGRDYPLGVAGDWSAPAVAELADALRDEPAVRAVSGPVAAVEPVAEVLLAGRPVERMDQQLFRLDALRPPDGVAGSAVVAGEAHRELVRAWFAAFMGEADAVEQNSDRAADRSLDGGHCYLWCDPAGEPVSLAARRPVISGSARIGPVYTPVHQRRHGYGAAVTSAATRSILDEGAVPVLFTDLANPTSNKIYQELGYRPVERRVIISAR